MYSLTVTEPVMIAHSLRGDVFGPAQRLHGATYEVELTLHCQQLSADGIVADIGMLSVLLKEILAPWNLQNLDDLADFSRENSTTEILAFRVHQQTSALIRQNRFGTDMPRRINEISVLLRESSRAWAGYRGPL